MSCSHHGTPDTIKRKPAKGLGDMWQRLKSDIHARFVKGVDPAHGYWEEHGHGHHHKDADPHKALTTHKKHPAQNVNLPKTGKKGAHWEYRKFGNTAKTGAILGAAAAIGVAIHGAQNITHGLKGEYDKNLDEQREPSTFKAVVGAAEVLGGAALLKKALTGRFRF